jgi:hypothetical protein
VLHRFAIVAVVWLFLVHAAVGQLVSRAFIAADGKVHLSYANHNAKVIPPEPQQITCEGVSVAEDQRTIGWLVLVDNCCTSYPIPTAVVLYRDDKKTVISTGQMIYEWHFVDRGQRIAVLSGPVHGRAATAGLYNARSGRLLAAWDGKGAAPDWAEGWKQHVKQ